VAQVRQRSARDLRRCQAARLRVVEPMACTVNPCSQERFERLIPPTGSKRRSRSPRRASEIAADLLVALSNAPEQARRSQLALCVADVAAELLAKMPRTPSHSQLDTSLLSCDSEEDREGEEGDEVQAATIPYSRKQSEEHHGLGLGRGAVDPTSRRLDDVERDASFWCSLVGTSRPSESTSMMDLDDVRERMLEECYDLTPERMVEIFRSLARDEDGRVSPESLGEGLRVCGVSGLDPKVPEKILQAVAPGCGGRLRPAEFETILSRLKLAQLLVEHHKGLGQPGQSDCRTPNSAVFERRLTVTDYDQRGANRSDFRDGGLCDFFFEHRPPPKSPGLPAVRWVHMPSLDLTLLLSLTVKYSLHPLGVEDVMEQCRTKVERYGEHFFAAMEHIALVGTPAAGGMEPVRVQGSHISAFCSGPPNLDTLVTVSQPDRSFREDWPGFAASSSGLASSDLATLSTASTTRSPPGDTAWVSRLRRRIEAPLSRIRQRRAHFLLLQVLDIAADDIVAVMHAYMARVARLEEELQELGIDVSSRWLDELSLIRLQLAVVARRARGLLRASRQLSAPDVREELSGYVRDIADHLDEAVDDTGILIEKCGAIIGSYERLVEREQDRARQLAGDRLNNTLFVLTVITTVLMPLQLAAGVYGMNFETPSGHPSIPELNQPRGYLWFWVGSVIYLSISCVFAAWLYLRNKKAAPRQILEAIPGAPLGARGLEVGIPPRSNHRTGM